MSAVFHLSSQTRQRIVRLLLGIIFLFTAAGTLGAGSYFLHIDTPTQHVAAWDLLNGCWGYTAATLVPFTFLLIPYAMFGLNPLWETVILSLLGAIMVWALFRTLERVTGSRRWALLGGLWFISLPIILYYTRMHVGYALVFFTLGLMLHGEKRYWWAGIAFGLTLTAHFNTLVPLGLWAVWSFILDKDTRRFKNLLWLGLGFLASLLVLETARWLFLGSPFGWIRGVVSDALRLSDVLSSDDRGSWPVWHILHWMSYANGPVNASILIVSLLYPTVRQPRGHLLDVTFAAGWSLIAFYSVRISLLGNTFMTPRMVALAYPLLGIACVFTISRLWQRASARLAGWQQAVLSVSGALIVAVGLPLAYLNQALDAAAGSQTAFDEIDALVEQAAEAGLPIRYFGYDPAGLAFGQRHGVPVAINEADSDILSVDGRSVRIIQNLTSDRVGTTLVEETLLNPNQYRQIVFPQQAVWRPAQIETYYVSPERMREYAKLTAGHGDDADRTYAVIYWPEQPQGIFIGQDRPDDLIFYYRGYGCHYPLPIGEGDQATSYYVILGENLREFWLLLRSGQTADAFRYLRDTLAN